MKKIIALFVAFLFASTNSCLAFSELYYVKNTTENASKQIVEEAYSNYNYNVQKTNPYYGTSLKNNENYAVVILQQSGNNMFYYYQSNDTNKINKRILKNFKNNGFVYEQSYNTNIISVYDNLAQKAVSNQTQSNYVFSDNTQNTYTNSTSNNYNYNNSQSANMLKGYVAQVDKGTKIQAYLQGAINTSSAAIGDQVVAVLTQDLSYNGNVIAPQGSLVYGTLSYARHATYGSRNGRVIINFNQLVTPDSKTYNISTEEVDFTVSNDGKVKSVASNAVVGAVVGGLAGLLIGAMTGNVGASAAIGAGVGAGGALIGGAAERGVDAEIPSFTELEITITKPFSVTISY